MFPSTNLSLLATLLRDNPLAVTGMGCISAAGDSPDALWRAAIAGRGLGASRQFDLSDHGRVRFPVCAAGAMESTAPEWRWVRRADRSVQMATLAAGQAWRQANLAGGCAPERMGVLVGSSRGPVGKMDQCFRGLGNGPLLPSMSAQSSLGALSGSLAQLFALKGPGGTISATCASAAFAIASAAEQILLGKADVMLVGGAEAPLHAVVLEQLQSAGVMGSHEDARQTCRPFDAGRDGTILGEGSAFLVLEPARSAEQRGAPALARLAGWAVGIDNSGRTGIHENGSGLLRVMTESVRLARLAPNDIGYINLHGTGTEMNDLAEARAVKHFFGDYAVPCSSTKPVTGHCLGAPPALEAVLCIEVLRQQEIPPTANYSRPDPRCDIQVLAGAARPARVSAAMSNSLGFWGYHASLIFTKAL